MSDLSRRPAACAGFKSLPGMLDISGVRCVCLSDGQLAGWDEVNTEICEWSADELDLDDPGTLGCLLALVRKAWGPRCNVVHWLDGGGWALRTNAGAFGLPDLRSGGPTKFYDTEAEGLVAALEAAP